MDEVKDPAETIKNVINDSIIQIPSVIPILPIDSFVIYPYMITPVIITDEANKKLIDEVLTGDKIIGLFCKKESGSSVLSFDNIYNVGTTAIIMRMLKIPDGTIRLLIHGLTRARIENRVTSEPYLKAHISIYRDEIAGDTETTALIKNCQNKLREIVEISPIPEDLYTAAMNITEPGKLADLIASNMNLRVEEQQQILEMIDPKQRIRKVFELISREYEVLKLGSKIQSDVKTRLDKNHKDYYLREQLKSIKKELGEDDAQSKEMYELREAVKQKAMPDNVRTTAEKELSRLEMMPTSSAEYTVSRTYIDWILALPWNESTTDSIDIAKAQEILDEDHYGLPKIKDRILEYLAVVKLKKAIKGPILCFVGAPGVGKTSLGKSIARALGRKFVRMSLGGMRDEAEIRGHRRTYIGSLPGRIIKSLKDCCSNNPVIMLDEIDKLGVDFRGDPASALLEVLDPEQNNSFVDHYLDLPFDLSKVMFITTANQLDPIPPPLRDRMEVLQLSGYTIKEKIIIAKKYLIPRQMLDTGLTAKNIKFNNSALERITESYTREAGLRNLEREIGNVCRKVAREVASGNDKVFHITSRNVEKFLGRQKYFSELAQRTKTPGTATGMAWTQFGGEILFIEAASTPGSGKLQLTGQLGDVMKESAHAALTFLNANCKELHIPRDCFEKYDVHIHVPAGAIPKDGPSAGITMATAMASLFKKEPIENLLAMTGEITLSGTVLPVGGIKEKVLAAQRAGIKKIILPERNKNDIEDIPAEVRETLEFFFVKNMNEVIKTVFPEKKNK